MTLIAVLLVVAAALLVGVIAWQEWWRRPGQRTQAEARLHHPTSIGRAAPTTAVRILRSDDDVTEAIERANASAARVAEATAPRRYRAPITRGH